MFLKYDNKMKRIFILSIVLTIGFALRAQTSNNYDFSAVAPSGQTLYYKLINNDTEVMIVKPSSIINYTLTGNIVIPDSVGYMGVMLPVTTIGENAFSGFSLVTSVSLSSSIRNIYSMAFRETSITQIEIPENVILIESAAFYSCNLLKKVVIFCRNASIASNIFIHCNNIEEAIFEKYIGLPKNNLKKVVFGDSIIGWMPTSFSNCDHLKEIIIGNGITSISNNCFNDCDSLRTIVIGSSISSIGKNAFRKCISLDTIYAKPINAPLLDSNVFIFTPASKVVVTYCNADYSTAWGTSGFNYHTADVYNINLNVNNTSYGSASITQAVDCENTATIMATPNQYYRFANWSDGDTTNPRVITLSQDTNITAMFERASYVVSTSSNNITMGNVEGDSVYNVGDNATLTAVAICGYRFNHWSNGSTNNPLTLIPTSDTNVVAFFEIALDTIYVPDTTLETIVIYDTTIIPVTIYDTNVVIVPVFDTMEFTIPIFDTVVLQIIDTSLAPVHDTIYFYDTIYLYDTIYIHDTIVTNLNDLSFIDAKVYISQGCIVVEGANVDRIMLFDINGRLLGVRRDVYNEVVRFNVPASGTYIIKIGNNTTRKVVVIK